MKTYYLDDEYNVYDEFGVVVGNVVKNGLVIDEENNLLKDDNVIGVIGGKLSDLSYNMQNNQSKGNVRTLKKNNNAGFGHVLVVALVLLCLAMFIGVIVLSIFG